MLFFSRNVASKLFPFQRMTEVRSVGRLDSSFHRVAKKGVRNFVSPERVTKDFTRNENYLPYWQSHVSATESIIFPRARIFVEKFRPRRFLWNHVASCREKIHTQKKKRKKNLLGTLWEIVRVVRPHLCVLLCVLSPYVDVRRRLIFPGKIKVHWSPSFSPPSQGIKHILSQGNRSIPR